MPENIKDSQKNKDIADHSAIEQENKMAEQQNSLAIADAFDKELNPLTAFEPTASDIKTSDQSIKFVGFCVFLIVFVLLGGWSALAPIDSAALAAGTVKVENNRKTVQHLEGGIVKAINVRDGDKVKKGDVLLVIEQTQALAELSILESQLAISRAVQARLLSERDNKETIEFPFIEIDDERISQVILNERQLFQARRTSLKGEVNLLEKNISLLENRISGLKILISNKYLLLKSYKNEIRDNKALLADGFVNKQRLVDVQRSKDSAEGEVAENQSNIDGLHVQIEETRLKILQRNSDFQRDVASNLSDIQSKVFDLEEKISAIADKVERTKVVAPSDGMILGLKIHTVGGVLSPGTPILDIVPEGMALIVEAEVSTTDIDQITLGMAADIRFSSFKSGSTPVIDGKVINISADSLLNESTGISSYLAQVEITEVGFEKLGKLELLPGMPAEVLINTGSRTVLEYLLQPATDAFARSMIEE
jgi:epimerase transport system membrane fusion protein